MATSRATPTVDELIQTIKHSSLPTVLVEGTADAKAYRGIEEIMGSLNASFIICDGRNNLLSIFDRRTEFAEKRVCFVADKDMWIFSGIPSQYSDLVFTDGYSIENDIYRDGNLEIHLTNDERIDHVTIIQELSRWFAFQVEQYLAKNEYRSDPHVNQLVPLPGFTCSTLVLAEHGYRSASIEIYRLIISEYRRRLRGKLLMEVLVRFFHAPHRQPRYGYDQLAGMAIAYGAQGQYTKMLIESIKSRLAANGTN